MRKFIMCSQCLATYQEGDQHELKDCVKNLNKQVKELQERIHELRERLAEYEGDEESYREDNA